MRKERKSILFITAFISFLVIFLSVLSPLANAMVKSKLIMTVDNPVPQSNGYFGSPLAWVGDADGDGYRDLALGSHRQNVDGISEVGQGLIVSGDDKSVICTINDPTPQYHGHFWDYIGVVKDVNGDGLQDVVVTEWNGFGMCQAHMFSGSDCSLIWSAPPGSRDDFDDSPADVGDIDGDGIHDVAIGAAWNSHVDVLSGADGSDILTINDGYLFSERIVGLGDINADGVPDFAAGNRNSPSGAYEAGQVLLLSGYDGSVIRTLIDPLGPQYKEGFGWGQISRIGDISADGVADLFVGANHKDLEGLSNVGQGFVFSGSDGSLLLTIDVPSPQANAYLGSSLLAMETPIDVDGDFVPDIFTARLVNGVGQVLIYSGASGELLLGIDHPEPQNVWFGLYTSAYQNASRVLVAISGHGQTVTGLTKAGRVYVFEIYFSESKPGDLNGDGIIDGEDYNELRKIFGKCKGDFGFNSEADYDEDGCVSYRDYRIWYGYYLDYSE